MKFERDGSTWACESFSSDDIQILKDGVIIAEWVAGNYSFKQPEISEVDLATVTETVKTFLLKTSKNI